MSSEKDLEESPIQWVERAEATEEKVPIKDGERLWRKFSPLRKQEKGKWDLYRGRLFSFQILG